MIGSALLLAALVGQAQKAISPSPSTTSAPAPGLPQPLLPPSQLVDPAASGPRPAPARPSPDDARQYRVLNYDDHKLKVRFQLDRGIERIDPVVLTLHLDEIGLSKDFQEDVGSEGVSWRPPSGLSVELKSVSENDARKPLLVTGRGSPVPSQMEVSPSDVKITKKGARAKPATLEFRVPNPAELRLSTGAGEFKGFMEVELSHPKWPEEKRLPVLLRIPIEVFIPGHLIVKFDLMERGGKDEPPRVGQPASVEVVVERFGVEDRGSGVLELDWKPEGAGGSAVVSLIKVPLPFVLPHVKNAGAKNTEEPGNKLPSPADLQAWDPIVEYDKWVCHPEWKTQVILAPAPSPVSDQVNPTSSGIQRERLRYQLILPDFFEPGEVWGKVSWDLPAGVVERKVERSLSGAPVRVGSGLVASPRIAFKGSTVSIFAVMSKSEFPGIDALTEIPVEVSGPVEIPAGGLSRIDMAGKGYVLFKRDVELPEMGEYGIEISRASEAARYARPLLIRVPFDMNTKMPDVPLVLFKGAPPLYWPLYGRGDDDGRDRSLKREDGLVLERRVDLLKVANLRFTGVFDANDPNGMPGRPLAPETENEPRIWFSESPNYDFPGTEKLQSEWSVVPGRRLALYFHADISDLVARGLPHNGTSRWLARWIITGLDANNKPFGRVFQEPFQLRVATQSDYYLSAEGAITAFAALVVLALIWGLLILIVKGISRRGSPQSFRRPRPSSQEEGVDDGTGLFGASSGPSGSVSQEFEDHQPQPHPQAKREEELTTAQEDWSGDDPFGKPQEDTSDADPFG